MKRDATLSQCGTYRYDLIREAESPLCFCKRCTNHTTLTLGYILWVGCNPSTASHLVDDPTETRIWGFTSRWGYGKFALVNSNPHRATNPNNQKVPTEKVLEINDGMIIKHALAADKIVVAWGTAANKELARRAAHLLTVHAAAKVYFLGRTKDGTPKHPLYLSNKTELVKW